MALFRQTSWRQGPGKQVAAVNVGFTDFIGVFRKSSFWKIHVWRPRTMPHVGAPRSMREGLHAAR
jgi:hypothetical protein